LAQASSSIIACSATDTALTSPTTASAMPRASSAARSTASWPTPWRDTTRSRAARAIVAAESGCVRSTSASARPISGA
jgi:hypothetical protein